VQVQLNFSDPYEVCQNWLWHSKVFIYGILGHGGRFYIFTATIPSRAVVTGGLPDRQQAANLKRRPAAAGHLNDAKDNGFYQICFRLLLK